jgi:hypothetical protein
LLVASVHPVYFYGGGSFAGRFGWAAVPLWIFPLSHAVKLLLERNKTIAMVLLCVSSIVLQGLLATKWLLIDGFLFNAATIWNRPHWASPASFYDSLLGSQFWVRLPMFKDFSFDAYLGHPANYVFVLMGLLLVVSGWLWQRRATRLVGAAWMLFLAAGIGALMLFPPGLVPWSVAGNTLPAGNTGTVVGESRVATEAENGAGLLALSAPAHLPSGKYEVVLEYETEESASDLPTAQWYIASERGSKPIAGGMLPPSTENGGEFKRRFLVREATPLGIPEDRAVYFSVLYTGSGYLSVERWTITPVSTALER